jgi:Protein of unknown function (DUF4230)
MTTRFLNLIFAVLLFGAGFMTHKYVVSAKEITAQEQSKVLLDKIREVTKLVTVEGNLSEIYNYRDYWGYDFFPFQKKAIILVDAKVSVGYDLQKMNLQSDALTKTLTISTLPAPEILSLEHDLKYYDISEGTFNSFSAKDYTELQGKAKDFIRQKAEESELKRRANTQGNKLIDMIRFMVEGAGWKLVIENQNVPIQKG